MGLKRKMAAQDVLVDGWKQWLQRGIISRWISVYSVDKLRCSTENRLKRNLANTNNRSDIRNKVNNHGMGYIEMKKLTATKKKIERAQEVDTSTNVKQL